jgi:hypothetical protein
MYGYSNPSVIVGCVMVVKQLEAPNIMEISMEVLVLNIHSLHLQKKNRNYKRDSSKFYASHAKNMDIVQKTVIKV